MRYRYLLVLATIGVFIACKKQKEIVTTSPQPPGSPAPVVLLKDVVIPNLPSPYYHFEYDASGKMNLASFASDFTRYNIIYDAGRIKELRNTIINNDTVRYFYDDAGRVIAANSIDITGTVHTKISLTYDGQQLIRLERKRLLGPDFVLNKVMTFSYYADGNLKELTDHRPAVNGQQVETTTINRFELYDDKINVDGFGLIHNDFFDHLVLLPGVQLQKNNSRKEIVTGDGPNHTVDYTYIYNDKNLPLQKTGDLLFTTGPNTGQRVQTNAIFSYYDLWP